MDIKKSIKGMWKNESGTIGLVTGVIMLIVSLAVLMIGLPILQGISDSASLESGDSLYNASETVEDTTESSYSMASVIPTLVIAIPVLGSLFALIFIFAGRRT